MPESDARSEMQYVFRLLKGNIHLYDVRCEIYARVVRILSVERNCTPLRCLLRELYRVLRVLSVKRNYAPLRRPL